MLSRMLGAALAAGLLAAGAPALHAQAGPPAPGWNDPTTLTLVRRGVDRRAQQLADTGLRDYTARANGYLTFLGQIGEGFTEPPRILKADQLALQVYWQAPDKSKQRIIGRRDTLLLPTDINYHRDHLGIVQNNFPGIIRLGDGDEVRDVPHPLSPAGLGAYDFRIADSLQIALPGRTLDVYEVKVRPRDDQLPRVIGSVYLQQDDAQVVRMAFSFTRAAFLDRQLEDLSIVLENGLVGGRFWLPRRQEIEIRRAGTWLDYPARGIIRGRWEIGEYALNLGLSPSAFRGPEIVTAPPAERDTFPWQGTVLDSLPPDVRATVDDDVARVQEEARALVREDALRRARGTAFGARAISDLLRADRVEGLALGAGATARLGNGLRLAGRVRYGTEDEEVKGQARFTWQRASGLGASLAAYRDFREAGDVVERSGIANTLAAQEFGSDYTDPFGVTGAALEVTTGLRHGFAWRLQGATERFADLAVNAAPAFGAHEAVLASTEADVLRGALGVERPTRLAFLGTEVALDAEVRVSLFRNLASPGVPTEPPVVMRDDAVVTRAAFDARLERPFGARRLVLHSVGAVAHADEAVPVTELVLFGGPVSAPGYGHHSLFGRAGFSQRVEVHLPVRFPALSLGRFGRSPGQARLVPFVHATGIHGSDAPAWRRDAAGAVFRAPRRVDGVYPSVGVGLLTVFDLLRIDVARGLRGGRWSFNVDVAREFWRVL